MYVVYQMYIFRTLYIYNIILFLSLSFNFLSLSLTNFNN